MDFAEVARPGPGREPFVLSPERNAEILARVKEADNHLVEIIRTELQGKSEPLAVVRDTV